MRGERIAGQNFQDPLVGMLNAADWTTGVTGMMAGQAIFVEPVLDALNCAAMSGEAPPPDMLWRHWIQTNRTDVCVFCPSLRLHRENGRGSFRERPDLCTNVLVAGLGELRRCRSYWRGGILPPAVGGTGRRSSEAGDAEDAGPPAVQVLCRTATCWPPPGCWCVIDSTVCTLSWTPLPKRAATSSIAIWGASPWELALWTTLGCAGAAAACAGNPPRRPDAACAGAKSFASSQGSHSRAGPRAGGTAAGCWASGSGAGQG